MTRSLPNLTAEGKAALDAHLEATVAAGNLPAFFFAVYNSEGPIYFACKGDRLAGQPEAGQVDESTTLQLFSMTKLVVAVSCLQLAEKGLVDFDDPNLLEKYCPELVAMPLLEGFADDGTPITRPRKEPLTLRRLLTHTSGLAYPFTFAAEDRWGKYVKAQSPLAPNATVEAFTTPLHFEPGTKYLYSTGIDWAGFLVWRLTGKTLEEYFQENIWGPCGVTGMTFYPSDDIKKHLMGLCGKADGKILPIDGPRPIMSLTREDIGDLSGGGGLLGTAKGYLTFLQHLLGCKDREGGIISPESFKLLFTNALPPRGETTAYEDLAAFLQSQAYINSAMLDGHKVEHSLGLALTTTDSPDGRRAGSGFWGGLAKTRFWIDPQTEIIGFCGTQILDPADPQSFFNVMAKMERIVYDHIEGQADQSSGEARL